MTSMTIALLKINKAVPQVGMVVFVVHTLGFGHTHTCYDPTICFWTLILLHARKVKHQQNENKNKNLKKISTLLI